MTYSLSIDTINGLVKNKSIKNALITVAENNGDKNSAIDTEEEYKEAYRLITGENVQASKAEQMLLRIIGITQEEEASKQSPTFRAEQLKNPAVGLSYRESGDYAANLQEAARLLNTLVNEGYWTEKQAREYAAGYPGLKNASEVLARNDLIRCITKDQPLDHSWGYKGEANKYMYDLVSRLIDLNGISQFSTHVEAIPKANYRLAEYFKNEGGLSATTEYVYPGFCRVTISGEREGMKFSLSLNIDQEKKEVSLLAFDPATGLVYGFMPFKSNPLIKAIFEKHERLNIKIPKSKGEDQIKERRGKEAAYQFMVSKLSRTNEIQLNDSKVLILMGAEVKQARYRVQPVSAGNLGTNGVGPCVCVIAKGFKSSQLSAIGLGHLDTSKDPEQIVENIVKEMGSLGIDRKNVQLYLVGGWEQSDQLQRQLIGLSHKYNIKGIKINLKTGDEYPEKSRYIDVAVTPGGDIFYGENGKLFKNRP